MYLSATLILLSSILGVFAGCRPDSCDVGQTCCPSATYDDEWNCCPEPNGVCCADGENCCPEGTVCDPSFGGCFPKMRRLVPHGFQKRFGPIEFNEVNVNRCDKRTFCPDLFTCCMNENGEHSCCPYQRAVCCHDKLHCCEEGETCDESSQYCIGKGGKGLAMPKAPAITDEVLYSEAPRAAVPNAGQDFNWGDWEE